MMCILRQDSLRGHVSESVRRRGLCCSDTICSSPSQNSENCLSYPRVPGSSSSADPSLC